MMCHLQDTLILFDNVDKYNYKYNIFELVVGLHD